MDKTMALFMAGGILLIVASAMGEDGPVSRLNAADAEGAQRVRQAYPQDAQPSAAQQETGRPSNQAWFAPGSSAPAGPAPSAIPVYHYEKVHIEVPQQVIDPAVAAASEIK
ncbi:MAG: hypothetical protein AB3N06_00415 [Erythrobacter sp.]